MRNINCNITPGTDAIAAGYTDAQPPVWIPMALLPDPTNPARCTIECQDAPSPDGEIGVNLIVMATGRVAFREHTLLPKYGQSVEGPTIVLKEGIPPFPSRADALRVQTHFQGLWVTSKAYSAQYQAQYPTAINGQIPYFGAALPDFDMVGDGDEILDQLQAAGDTHVLVFLSRGLATQYNEPNQPYGQDQIVKPSDYWQNIWQYLNLVDRVIARGLKPVYLISGEGQPGYAWIKENLAAFVAIMRQDYDRLRYGPISIAFDGVWPATWTVAQMMEMIPWMRSVIGPDAYLNMWFGNGPAGGPYLYVESEADYSQPWMDGLDGVLTTTGADQVQCPSLPNYAQYMIGAALTPSGLCTPQWHGPYIMVPCSRGERFWGIIEWDTYGEDRDPDQSMKPAIDNDRARIQSLGIEVWG